MKAGKKNVPFMATRGERIFYKINNVVMLVLIAITVYPMLYVVFCSFSNPDEYAFQMGRLLLRPAGFSIQGYRTIISMNTIWQGYRNTLMYVVLGTGISMMITIMGAFILSHPDFMLKRVTMALVVFTMYFSGGMIPTYLVVTQLKLTNSIWGFLLPGAVSVYNLIVLRTAFNSVPKALLESAEIDLFYAVTFWGSWYNALVYLQKRRDLYPLQMILRELLITDKTTDSMVTAFNGQAANQYLLKEIVKYCAIVVSTLPILAVYPFIQKYFVKGVMLGAIKE